MAHYNLDLLPTFIFLDTKKYKLSLTFKNQSNIQTQVNITIFKIASRDLKTYNILLNKGFYIGLGI